MRLEFIANACCKYTSQGKSLLSDPWLFNGVFGGSWFHTHEIVNNLDRLVQDTDYLYISHLHPDHYDEKSLGMFKKTTPVICLDDGPNYLLKKLKGLGFKDIITIKDKESRELGPFKLTMYKAFCGNAFYDTEFGNPIDSALVIEDHEGKVLNTNDNTLDEQSALMLRDRHGVFNVAQLQFNSAGPYPACFDNLTTQEKVYESNRLINRNLQHMVKIAKILRPNSVMPFAGAYQLGGKLKRLNPYLGTTTSKDASDYLEQQGIKPFRVGELPRLDPPGEEWPYEHQLDEIPDELKLMNDIAEAFINLENKQEKLNLWPRCKVILKLLGRDHIYNFHYQPESTLICYMDPRLLRRILDRKEHWNNAEIGCHIRFHREPNKYNPDVHMLMSYFHL